jgi:hypothetical protein
MEDAPTNESQEYWFPAKRYGWGWGFPRTWQGWVVFAVYGALQIAGIVMLPPARHPVGFPVFTIALVMLLVAVCWLKGEPPRWRWGKD